MENFTDSDLVMVPERPEREKAMEDSDEEDVSDMMDVMKMAETVTALRSENPAHSPNSVTSETMKEPTMMISREKRPSFKQRNANPPTRPPVPPQVLQRAQSMRSIRPLNSSTGHSRTKSFRRGVDRSASFRRTGVERTPSGRRPGVERTSSFRHHGVERSNSSRVGSRAPPSRTSSTDSALRGHQRDQLVNTPLERKESIDSLTPYRGGTLDDPSISTMATSDADSFAMDSIHLRKGQLIADPMLDDGTYNECDSYACHDSFSHFSGGDYNDYLPEGYGNLAPGNESLSTFCTLDSVRLRRMQIKEDVLDTGYDSISTMNTGDYYGDYPEEETFIEERNEDESEADE